MEELSQKTNSNQNISFKQIADKISKYENHANNKNEKLYKKEEWYWN